MGKNSLRNRFLGETYVTYVQQEIAGYPRLAMSLRERKPSGLGGDFAKLNWNNSVICCNAQIPFVQTAQRSLSIHIVLQKNSGFIDVFFAKGTGFIFKQGPIDIWAGKEMCTVHYAAQRRKTLCSRENFSKNDGDNSAVQNMAMYNVYINMQGGAP